MNRRTRPRRLLRRLALILVIGVGCQSAEAGPLAFKAALADGIVDLMFNPWSRRSLEPLIAQTIALRPGFVNRLGFAYGGPTRFWLDRLGVLALALRSGLPTVRLGGGFPEVVTADYSQALSCDDDAPPLLFEATSIAKTPTEDGKFLWVDLSRPEAIVYYACIGKILIRQGFSHFHFEQGITTVEKSTSVETALEGLRQLQADLMAYGRKHDMVLSFSSDPDLARRLELDAVYMPSRFYTNGFARKDRNRIDVPSLPGGYTYALSARIVRDTLATLPAAVKALFYVDNFDASQDDLRRLMELGPAARRDLILRSSRTAAVLGAVFIPALNHCEGCVASGVVTDRCEIIEGSALTEYDTAACGDMATIGEALDIQRRAAGSK